VAIIDRNQAKDGGGFAQVREALTSFRMVITAAEFGEYSGGVGDDGKPLPPKEYLDIKGIDVEVLETTEELDMDISAEYSIRINCSPYKGSFWIEKFLESTDKFKILVPDGLVGKKITFKKETLKAFDKKGNPKPKFDSTSYVISAVDEASKTEAVPAPAAAIDYNLLAIELANGKTDQQFKAALVMHPAFVSNPTMLNLARSGALLAALVSEKKLVATEVNGMTVYSKPA
jgi:hypothetical protein